jgi:hypothetical protein
MATLTVGVYGQTDPAPASVLQVDFSNPGISPPRWTLVLHPDGTGHFRTDRDKPSPDEAVPAGLPDVNRDIQVSARFAEYVFQMAKRKNMFNQECETNQKLAFQGWKTFTYIGPEGKGSCRFNYAKDKDIQALGDSLVAVAETILEGARLESLLQHDRLGLDKEMEYLGEAAADGRIRQICTIRGILERLEDDPDVLDRVRKRARALLAQSEK